MTAVAAMSREDVHLYDGNCGCWICSTLEVACSMVAISEAGKAALELMDQEKPGRMRNAYGEAAEALHEAGEAMHRYVNAVQVIRDLNYAKRK